MRANKLSNKILFLNKDMKKTYISPMQKAVMLETSCNTMLQVSMGLKDNEKNPNDEDVQLGREKESFDFNVWDIFWE